MSDDLKLINQLEREIGIKLQRRSQEEIGHIDISGFVADDEGRVQELAIRSRKMPCPPVLFSKFQGLEKLELSTDVISSLNSANPPSQSNLNFSSG